MDASCECALWAVQSRSEEDLGNLISESNFQEWKSALLRMLSSEFVPNSFVRFAVKHDGSLVVVAQLIDSSDWKVKRSNLGPRSFHNEVSLSKMTGLESWPTPNAASWACECVGMVGSPDGPCSGSHCHHHMNVDMNNWIQTCNTTILGLYKYDPFNILTGMRSMFCPVHRPYRVCTWKTTCCLRRRTL